MKHINQPGAKTLLMGPECPKQKTWMAEKRDIGQAIMIDMGGLAYFDAQQNHTSKRMDEMLNHNYAQTIADREK